MNTNNEKDFVPYEQALALKELGFDEPCMCFYNNRKELKVYHNVDKDWDTLEHQLLGNSKITLPNTYSAPTFSQAFRWFREKHNIDAWVQPFTLQKSNGDLYLPDETYSYFIFKYGVWVGDGVDFLEPEEAELACLNKLIEIVKQQTYATNN